MATPLSSHLSPPSFSSQSPSIAKPFLFPSSLSPLRTLENPPKPLFLLSLPSISMPFFSMMPSVPILLSQRNRSSPI